MLRYNRDVVQGTLPCLPVVVLLVKAEARAGVCKQRPVYFFTGMYLAAAGREFTVREFRCRYHAEESVETQRHPDEYYVVQYIKRTTLRL